MCLKGIATTVLVLAAMTVFAVAQVPIERVQKVENGSNAGPRPSSGPARYSYVFENERFTTQLIELNFDNSGRGKFHFKRKDGQDVTNDLKVSSSVVSQIRSLFDGSDSGLLKRTTSTRRIFRTWEKLRWATRMERESVRRRSTTVTMSR